MASQVAANNLRGKVYQNFDTAGVLTNHAYDFKGNLLRSERVMIRDFKSTPDWSVTPPPALELDVFTSSTVYDALNRPAQVIPPHLGGATDRCNVIEPRYNEAGLLERELVWLNEAAEPQGLMTTAPTVEIVTNVDYNAKGQRERINYGNQIGRASCRERV